MSKKTPQLKNDQKDLVQLAVRIANETIRDMRLGLDQRKGISLLVSNYLRRHWDPFQEDYESNSGFALKMDISDPVVRDIINDPELYQIAVEIVEKSIREAIMVGADIFVSSMLEDLFHNPDSYYEELTYEVGEQLKLF